jgi:hypothetical protein
MKGSRKQPLEPQPCCVQGCTAMGKIRVENDNWMCSLHVTERINSPGNVAASEADEELTVFRESGGRLS